MSCSARAGLTLSTQGKSFNRWHTEIFFIFVPENKFWHFMQIVSNGANLHEMSNLFSEPNKNNMNELAQRIVRVEDRLKCSHQQFSIYSVTDWHLTIKSTNNRHMHRASSFHWGQMILYSRWCTKCLYGNVKSCKNCSSILLNIQQQLHFFSTSAYSVILRTFLAFFFLYGQLYVKMCLQECTDEKAPDQPAHPRSLIRAFPVR